MSNIQITNFFEEIDQFFTYDHQNACTTGFSRLDEHIHDGNGPSKGEVLVFYGYDYKSIIAQNAVISNLLQGKNILHISLEDTKEVITDRYMGALTHVPIELKQKKKEEIISKLNNIKKTSNDGLTIVNLPITSDINDVKNSVKMIKEKNNYEPDVIVVDSLDDLTGLKALAQENNVFVITTKKQTKEFNDQPMDESNSSFHAKVVHNYKQFDSEFNGLFVDYVILCRFRYTPLSPDRDNNINYGKMFLIKNKYGRKYMVCLAKINIATTKVIKCA